MRKNTVLFPLRFCQYCILIIRNGTHRFCPRQPELVYHNILYIHLMHENYDKQHYKKTTFLLLLRRISIQRRMSHDWNVATDLYLKPVFHLANLFAQTSKKRMWLAGDNVSVCRQSEQIRQVENRPNCCISKESERKSRSRDIFRWMEIHLD